MRLLLGGTASFFDIDGVIYDGYLGIDFLRYLCESEVLSKFVWQELLNIKRLHGNDSETFFLESARLWSRSVKGKSLQTIRDAAKSFVEEKVAEKIKSKAIQALKKDEEEGNNNFCSRIEPVHKGIFIGERIKKTYIEIFFVKSHFSFSV